MCAKPGQFLSQRLGAAVFADLAIPAALVDLKARVVLEVNPALTKWIGLSPDELADRNVNDLIAQLDFLWITPPLRAAPASFESHEASFRLKSGEVRYVLLSAAPLELDERTLHLITLQDITARVQADRQVRQLKRLYATLSQVNQTIVRITNRADLYQSICDVAVRFGEFSAAWLGLWSENTATLHPVVVRTAVEELPLERVSEALAVPRSTGADDLVAAALWSSKVTTRAHVPGGSRLLWPSSLSEPSHQAVAVIPFRLRGKTIGVVGLVGPEASSLTSDDEIRLLDEMGLDISYALDMLETAVERTQAQAEVQAQALRLKILADASHAFAAAGGDYSALLNEIVRRVADHLGESCGIRLISADGRILTLAAAHSTNVDALEILRSVQPQAPERVDGPGLVPHVARTGDPVFLPEVTLEQSRAAMSGALWSRLARYRFRSLIIVPLRAHGQNLGVMLIARHTLRSGPYTTDDLALAEDLASRAALAIFNARLLQQVQDELAERQRIGEALRASEATLQLFIDHAPAALAMFDRDMRYLAVSHRWLLDYGLDGQNILGHSHYEIFPEIPDYWKDAHQQGLSGQTLSMDEDPFTRASGTVQWLRWVIRPWTQVDGSVGGIVIFTEDITALKHDEARIQYQAELLENVSDAIISTDADYVIHSWNAAAEAIYGWTAEEAIGRSASEVFPTEYIGSQRSEALRSLAATGRWKGDVVQHRRDGSTLNISSAVSQFQASLDGPSRLVAVNRDVTDRVNVERRLETQVQRLRALRTIDQAITSSFDLRVTLDVLLEQGLAQLQADGAIVLLLNQPLHRLEYAASRGFASSVIRNIRLPLGQGHAGRAALERRLVHVPNLLEAGGDLARTLVLEQEHFVSYFGMPLIAKGSVKGVLEVFHRHPFDPEPDWIEFLASLAGQAAIAVDSAQLFESLERSHHDLAIAYDATIEGWSRAMDLRDHETEGHTQRVTEVVVKLAIAAGMSNEALAHVRRGALLHDIGKLGIPDRVLFKPTSLTADEWSLMRQHPQFAYDMLAAIPYLRSALDIPYYHHEKWDGTGYPHGLRGEQIPLAARLFAVVDVWDALRSERPYRPAWPDDRVLDHLRAESGKHFDPWAVTLFLEILRTSE